MGQSTVLHTSSMANLNFTSQFLPHYDALFLFSFIILIKFENWFICELIYVVFLLV